jgi:hypothetical protein
VADTKPSPGAIAVMAGGGVALVGSFLDAVPGASAWGSGAFPILTLIPLYCVVAGVLVALTTFAKTNLPENVLGFTWTQLYFVLGDLAALMAVCWIIVGDAEIGLFLMLAGSIAVGVGGFLMDKDAAPAPGPGPAA